MRLCEPFGEVSEGRPGFRPTTNKAMSPFGPLVLTVNGRVYSERCRQPVETRRACRFDVAFAPK